MHLFHKTIAALAFLSASAAWAVAPTWSSTASTGSLSTASNWNGNIAPASSTSMMFGTSTTTALTNDYTSLTLLGLTFNGNSSFTLSGNAITMSGTITQSSSYSQVLNTDLALTTGISVNVIGSAASMTFGGVVSGNYTLSKGSGGSLFLTGANTQNGLLINNGTVIVSGSGTLGRSSGELNLAQSTGRLNLNGTSQSVGNLTGASGSTIFNDSTGTSTLTIGSGGGTGGTFAGAIIDNNTGTGKMALTKIGSGTIILSGANTFSGGTTVSAGVLTLGASNALSGATGSVTVNGGKLNSSVSAATLGGNLVFSSGTISPNDTGVGTLTLAAGKSFSMSGGTLALNLGTAFDQITGTGALSLTGGTIAFDTTGAGFSYTSSYQIFSGFGNTSFSALTLSGYDSVNYLASISDSGVLSFATAGIPEPSTYAAIFGATALGLAAWRRRRTPRDERE